MPWQGERKRARPSSYLKIAKQLHMWKSMGAKNLKGHWCGRGIRLGAPPILFKVMSLPNRSSAVELCYLPVETQALGTSNLNGILPLVFSFIIVLSALWLKLK